MNYYLKLVHSKSQSQVCGACLQSQASSGLQERVMAVAVPLRPLISFCWTSSLEGSLCGDTVLIFTLRVQLCTSVPLAPHLPVQLNCHPQTPGLPSTASLCPATHFLKPFRYLTQTSCDLAHAVPWGLCSSPRTLCSWDTGSVPGAWCS
jgi:hypothetical protein